MERFGGRPPIVEQLALWEHANMPKIDIHPLLEGKWEDGTRPKDLYSAHVSHQPESYLADIVGGLASTQRRVQNGCAELASLLSEDRPELFVAHLPLFVANLEAKEPILRWEAACVVGNLAAVDKSDLVTAQLPKLARNLEHKSIVLQGHSVRAMVKIARANPERAGRILGQLQRSSDRFPANRIGHLIDAMEGFVGFAKLHKKIRAFVSPHADSEINSVSRKAKRVLEQLDLVARS